MSDAVRVAQFLADVLEKLGVVYWISGSMASSAYGLPRSTQNVDLVAELKEEHIDDFVAALENVFTLIARLFNVQSVLSDLSMSSIWIRCTRLTSLFLAQRLTRKQKKRGAG